jgi:hypothetical protein
MTKTLNWRCTVTTNSSSYLQRSRQPKNLVHFPALVVEHPQVPHIVLTTAQSRSPCCPRMQDRLAIGLVFVMLQVPVAWLYKSKLILWKIFSCSLMKSVNHQSRRGVRFTYRISVPHPFCIPLQSLPDWHMSSARVSSHSPQFRNLSPQ